MQRHGGRPQLFDDAPLPHGLLYRPDFLGPAEEAAILEILPSFPFQEALFQQYRARRRVVRFGSLYDEERRRWTGWHRDRPHYGTVVGVSLGNACRMRFRPLDARHDRNAPVSIELEPRSAYAMREEIRWQWQHHIPPTKALRYSITLRTRA
jgi:hypothetical protein